MNITDYMQKHHMVQKGDLVLAAVSGGVDSVCMLLLLKEAAQEMGYTLAAVHVEHGIRGEESLEDMRFVQELCEELGVPLRVCHAAVPEYAAAKGMGLEEAARELRYQIFDQVAAEALAQGWQGGACTHRSIAQIRLALAHHMQDQAETVLFHLVRGSGARGLAGMQPVRKTPAGYSLIRPMLSLQRTQIEQILKERGQAYRIDATNQDVSYARNRLRICVMPELEQINAQAAAHIAQAAEHIGKQQDYIWQEAAQQLKAISRYERGVLEISIPQLKQLHGVIQRELLWQALTAAAGREKDIGSVHVDRLLALADMTSGSRISLPYRITAVREFDRIALYCAEDASVSTAGRTRYAQEQVSQDQESVPYDQDLVSQDQEPVQPINIGSDALEQLHQTGGRLTIALDEDEILHLSVCRVEEAAERTAGMLSNLEFASEKCKKTCTKCLDYDKIKEGFSIRRRQPGDTLLMADGHHKKLKQYLIEERIPAGRRQQLWLLAREHQVLWAVGGRESADCRMTEHTEYAVCMVYERKDGPGRPTQDRCKEPKEF